MLEWLLNILDWIATAEGNFGALWRFLGLKRLAEAILARRRKVKAFGMQFFQDRATLEKERSWTELVDGVEEIDAMLVVGDMALRERHRLDKIKRLLLPNPDGASVAFYAKATNQDNIPDLIRQATRDAQTQRVKIRWCPEFLGYSLLLLDKNSLSNARVHIEYALPGLKLAYRPSVVMWRRRFPQTFAAFRSAFDDLWEISGEPSLTVNDRRMPDPDPIQIVFDPTDSKCMRTRADGVTWYCVGVRNATDNRTMYNVSVRALEGDFAARVLSVVHGKISPYTGRPVQPDPVLAEWARLDPGATEYFQLFATPLGHHDDEDRDVVFRTLQKFSLEVRAVDTKRAVAVFEYNPVRVPALTRLS
jgi:hypothetical protein